MAFRDGIETISLSPSKLRKMSHDFEEDEKEAKKQEVVVVEAVPVLWDAFETNQSFLIIDAPQDISSRKILVKCQEQKNIAPKVSKSDDKHKKKHRETNWKQKKIKSKTSKHPDSQVNRASDTKEEFFDGDQLSKIHAPQDGLQLQRKSNHTWVPPTVTNQQEGNNEFSNVIPSQPMNKGCSEDGLINEQERLANTHKASFDSPTRIESGSMIDNLCRTDAIIDLRRQSKPSITFAQPSPILMNSRHLRSSLISRRQRTSENVLSPLDANISKHKVTGTSMNRPTYDNLDTVQASCSNLIRDSLDLKIPPLNSGRDNSVSGFSSCIRRYSVSGSVITFQNIEYMIPLRKTICSKVTKKIVLNGVSGIMRPGVNAIMGPTGCGKSSLLDTLAGRKNPKFLSGEVLIDGYPQPKNFKCISGYVVQDDILMGTLTVRETLYMAAMLRRKNEFTKAETTEKVIEILEELGLSHIADSKIGTELIRGISGGERKRTSIGMEIISDPSVLFLDEPTTGLDAFTAGSVIKTLKTLSRRGRTIVLSIHQPKYSIYKLFDSLTLIANGKLVYHGPAGKEPIKYFANLGFICEAHNNPPDFFLDVLHGELKPLDTEQATVKMGDQSFEADFIHIEAAELMKESSEHLINAWNDSPENQHVKNEVLAVTNRLSNTNNPKQKPKTISYAAPFCRQLQIVCWRTSLSLIRDPQASIVQTLVYLFFAISMGVVYFGLDTSLESGIQNRAGLFFFAVLQVVFVNIGSIELFLKERALFIHEHSSGYYRVSAYFIAKLMCDVLPTKALPVFFFMPITYWMVKLVPQAGKFFFFELILILGTVSAAAAGICVSAAVTLFSIANVIISIVFVFMMVFGGFLINLTTLSPYLSWLRYLSIFYYTFGGLLVNEMTDLEFCSITNKTKAGFAASQTCQLGQIYLENLDFASGTIWDLWLNVIGLVCISTFCFVICYILLRRINTYK